MRRRHRSDNNQNEIVKALEAIGCDVFKIDRPVDLLVGYRSRNFLIECKNKKGKNKLTEFQEKWIPSWRGQVRIVHTADEAIALVTESYGGKK